MSTPTAPAEMTCYTPTWHPAHTWTYGGTPVACSGIPDPAIQGPDDLANVCDCTDPMCPDSKGRATITDRVRLPYPGEDDQ